MMGYAAKLRSTKADVSQESPPVPPPDTLHPRHRPCRAPPLCLRCTFGFAPPRLSGGLLSFISRALRRLTECRISDQESAQSICTGNLIPVPYLDTAIIIPFMKKTVLPAGGDPRPRRRPAAAVVPACRPGRACAGGKAGALRALAVAVRTGCRAAVIAGCHVQVRAPGPRVTRGATRSVRLRRAEGSRSDLYFFSARTQ